MAKSTPKPKALQWLEEQTGQDIEYPTTPPATNDRHLSVRLSSDLAAGLERIASERGLQLSQFVRELLTIVVAERDSVGSLDDRALADRLASDVAEVRRRLAG
jgi:predicted DNA binding CopG/RHH family protein